MIQSDNEQFVTYIDVTYTVQTPNTIDINSCCCYAGKIQIKFGLILVEKKEDIFNQLDRYSIWQNHRKSCQVYLCVQLCAKSIFNHESFMPGGSYHSVQIGESNPENVLIFERQTMSLNIFYLLLVFVYLQRYPQPLGLKNHSRSEKGIKG